jgi:hypothetical protein
MDCSIRLAVSAPLLQLRFPILKTLAKNAFQLTVSIVIYRLELSAFYVNRGMVLRQLGHVPPALHYFQTVLLVVAIKTKDALNA